MITGTDLYNQNFYTAQNKLQPMPNTIASATTIAPSTLITYLTGTAAVATITPPLTGQHMLVLVFTDSSPGTTLTTGNISNAIIPTQNLPTLMFYNPILAKYFGGTMNLT